jgi:DNA-binding LacI/PurR family transcriptional regulator
VRSDDLRGADLAVTHLIRQGRFRIATLLLPTADVPARRQLRFQGYRRALRRAGIPFDARLTLETGWDTPHGEELVRRLAGRIAFDAVFVPTDMAAIGAMLALRKAGRRVPDDVAVAGYCNLREGQHLTPSLTTVNQHPEVIGRTAAQLILDRLAGKAIEAPKVHWIEPELIVRESSGGGVWSVKRVGREKQTPTLPPNRSP